LEIIKAENLSFKYEDDQSGVINNLSFQIEEGDFVAILGHNGSGKSTLAKLFSGILSPVSGKLTVAGHDVSDQDHIFELRGSVGMVFQNPDNQIISSIVEEDVAFALENLGVPYEEMRRKVDDALDSVGMSEYKKHSTTKLSGGQKQRVAIAGVIAMSPKVLVLDEPTAMLDPQGRKEVMKVLKELNSKGITVVLITHFMNEAAQANRCIVVDNGNILVDGTPREVFSRVELLRSVGLDAPQSAELMFALQKQGIDVPVSVLTDDECVAALKDLLNGK
jgi:energy-coupling factor transport system ATP-binding protein